VDLILVAGLTLPLFKNDSQAPHLVAKQVLGLVYIPLFLSFLVTHPVGGERGRVDFLASSASLPPVIRARFIQAPIWAATNSAPGSAPRKPLRAALGGLAAKCIVALVFKTILLPSLRFCLALFCLGYRYCRAGGGSVRIRIQTIGRHQGFRDAASRSRGVSRPAGCPSICLAACLSAENQYILIGIAIPAQKTGRLNEITFHTGCNRLHRLQCTRNHQTIPGSVHGVRAHGEDQRGGAGRQIIQFTPRLAAVVDADHAKTIEGAAAADMDVANCFGEAGYVQAATCANTDMVLGAMVGAAGLVPTLAAIDAGKDIALANKETLVMAGAIVMEKVARRGVKLMPVDSEHSAIFQSMAGHGHNGIREILLTASGGPFLSRPAASFDAITRQDALRHPNWSMGSKISIDSATLMNKGLEVIEARWLFDIGFDRIKVVVHPQSIVHSMVVYEDGAVIAQMGVPDMKGAIAYGLSHPRRLPLDVPAPDFARIGGLTFEDPDLDRFPCLAGLSCR
jgi:1-deoxy-D-xylulose 5-phosphate reductoisomerase